MLRQSNLNHYERNLTEIPPLLVLTAPGINDIMILRYQTKYKHHIAYAEAIKSQSL